MTHSERQPAGSPDKYSEPDDIYGIFKKDIGKHPDLTREEEYTLMTCIIHGRKATYKLAHTKDHISPTQKEKLERRIQDGLLAWEKMITRNQGLVIKLAKKKSGHGVEFLDLIQEGNIGLIRALQDFDPERGKKFSTYATWWIRQIMNRTIKNQGRTIRLPENVCNSIYTINHVQQRMTTQLGRKPTSAEIAAEIPGLTQEKIHHYLEINQEIQSLDQPVGDGNITLGDILPADNESSPVIQSTHTIMKDDVATALKSLSEREISVIQLRNGFNGEIHSLRQAGSVIGRTPEGVRIIEIYAMKKLRRWPIQRKLEEYLVPDRDA